MKRANLGDDATSTADDKKMKKIKIEEEEEEEEEEERGKKSSGFTNLDNNLLFEVFKHVDAKTLGMAGCVSKQWHDTAQDERLWELICTRQWANIGCGNQQLRSVVLALGGFRRLHSLYIWPLSKPQSSSSSSSSASASSSSSVASSSAAASSWGPLPPMISSKPQRRWGKDEVNLSLSLLSIRFFEKMNYTNKGR
ncbi:F-box domain containing protein [Parasponia andersonii]|uniref:F-box domain containing protein n=1 Tax=Parasponia andersonii TaxID=3476 RepID=A0A2P5BJD9_PARAD|nr:F-box domain containing protein [Parasponia andersonii]